MTPEIALKELGTLLGLDVQLSIENTCAISFDDELVEFETTDLGLFVFGAIGSLEGKEFLYKKILEGNFTSMRHELASMCLEKDTLVLHRIFPTPLDMETLVDGLSQFVTGMRYWKEWLEAVQDDSLEGGLEGGLEDSLENSSNDSAIDEHNDPMPFMLRV